MPFKWIAPTAETSDEEISAFAVRCLCRSSRSVEKIFIRGDWAKYPSELPDCLSIYWELNHAVIRLWKELHSKTATWDVDITESGFKVSRNQYIS